MSLSDKLFSLLGFAEPTPLKRSNKTNQLPKSVLLLSVSESLNADVEQTFATLATNTIKSIDNLTAQSIEGLVIDATNYSDESSYQQLYLITQAALKSLRKNAKILVIANAISTKQSAEQNAFSQALVGFSKSLAKEVGRKGSTANIIFIEAKTHNMPAALISPISFLLSPKSAFISGQILTIDNQNELIEKSDRKKVAVVTGAAQGIGAAIARKLTNESYFVIGIDIAPMQEKLAETMSNLQGEGFTLDVSIKNAGEQLATLANKHGGFDLVVHNAGITRDKTLAKMPEHFWQQTLNINLLSVMRINKVLMNERSINEGGCIVCLSSMNGIAGQGGQTNYACSKAGVIGYVNSMATTLAKNKIRINAVAPGFIETQMTEQIPYFTREMGRRMNALGQGGLPIDVAEAIAFLGDEASFAISGQTLRVCGLNIIGA